MIITSADRQRSARSVAAAAGFGLLAVAVALLIGAPAAGAQAAASGGTPAGSAWLRAAHLVPGLGAARVELTAEGSGSKTSILMTPNASYGLVTAYQQVPIGTYLVTIQSTEPSLAGAPVLSRSLTLAADKAYTIAALGTQAAPRLDTLTDDLTPPAAGQGRVRVLTAASTAPDVSVTADRGPTIVDHAVLGQASTYTAVPAGSWRLQASTSTGITATQTVQVASGSVYTLLVLDGTFAGSAPRLDLVTDAAGAVAMPAGGAATGGGGTATDVVGRHKPADHHVFVQLLALLLAAAAAAQIRRPTTPLI